MIKSDFEDYLANVAEENFEDTAEIKDEQDKKADNSNKEAV